VTPETFKKQKVTENAWYTKHRELAAHQVHCTNANCPVIEELESDLEKIALEREAIVFTIKREEKMSIQTQDIPL
jgi:hypothetical protein